MTECQISEDMNLQCDNTYKKVHA